MKYITSEIIITLVLIVMIVLFLNPFGFWMPQALTYMMLIGLIVVGLLFAGIVWKEQPEDEREELHSMLAGRVGYLTATGILLVGIVVQALSNSVDPWLLYALAGAVIGKMVARWYGRHHL